MCLTKIISVGPSSLFEEDYDRLFKVFHKIYDETGQYYDSPYYGGFRFSIGTIYKVEYDQFTRPISGIVTYPRGFHAFLKHPTKDIIDGIAFTTGIPVADIVVCRVKLRDIICEGTQNIENLINHNHYTRKDVYDGEKHPQLCVVAREMTIIQELEII